MFCFTCAFCIGHSDEMIEFYTIILGRKLKTYVKFKEYLSRPIRMKMYEIMQYTEDSYQMKGHISE